MVERFFDELSDGIVLSDVHGKILYLNPAAERLLQASSSKARKKRICELLCGHLSVDGEPECASTCELLRPGSAAEAVTFQGNYGPKEIATWRDFGVRRRRVYRNLRVRCLRAPASLVGRGRHLTLIEDDAAVAKQKEDWRQMIACDLLSPLTSIYSAICLFQEAGGSPLPDGSRDLVDAAERSARKMLELMTLSMDVDELDAGVREVKREPVRLADAVRSRIEAQAPAAASKRVEIVAAVPDEIVVEADPELLSRVIANVLDNAVKFTPAGGRVELTARRDGGSGELSIKDTGPGLAREALPLLFDRAHQARERRAGRLQGTGLGLTFCRAALSAMRGSIAVDSKPGAGAEFFLRLPAAAAPLP